MARKSVLNKELIDELCKWVEDDVPFRFCAEGCGITFITFNNWMKKGEDDFENEIESLEAELFYRIKKTYASVVRESVRIIRTKPMGWQGQAWIRQRRDNEFMDKQEFVSNGEQVIVNLGNLKGKHNKVDKDA